MDLLRKWDIELFFFLNGSGREWIDPLMIWFSAKWFWIPLYALLLYLLFKKYNWRVWIPIIFLVGLITLTDQFTSSFMKPFFERFRPCHDPLIQPLVRLVDKCGGKYGFASSHAANTMGVAVFLQFIWSNQWTKLLIIWSVVVGYSRIYLGVHYPGDVLVGFLVGTGAALMTILIMNKVLKKDY